MMDRLAQIVDEPGLVLCGVQRTMERSKLLRHVVEGVLMSHSVRIRTPPVKSVTIHRLEGLVQLLTLQRGDTGQEF